MRIRIGFELMYECLQPTPMLLMVNVHHTRSSDLVVPDHLVTDPPTPIQGYRDGFGNWCSRIVAPAGMIRLSSAAIVKDTGEPDAVGEEAPQHAGEDLPEEALEFLLPSRHCATYRLSAIAWAVVWDTTPSCAR